MPRVVPTQAVVFIDKLFPKHRDQLAGERRWLTKQHEEQLVALLEVIQQIPSELITLDHDDYVEYICSIAAVRHMIEVWKTREDAQFNFIGGLRELSPIALIRHGLLKCPDEFPSGRTSDLKFILDDLLRERLRLDISSVESAFTHGEWKSATVLAGSVVEALLLWALQQKEQNDVNAAVRRLGLKIHPDLEQWVLAQYIDVAVEMQVIREDSAIQCRLAKDFRNLIHPGRALRLAQKCNRGTAMSAIAALEHVVTDLCR